MLNVINAYTSFLCNITGLPEKQQIKKIDRNGKVKGKRDNSKTETEMEMEVTRIT